MKKILLLAAAFALFSTTACDELASELEDELSDQLSDPTDDDEYEDENENENGKSGNDDDATLLYAGLIKSAMVVFDDDDDEQALIEFSYNDSDRISEMKATWTYLDDGEMESETYRFTYEYTSSSIIVSNYETDNNSDEEYQGEMIMALNDEGWIESYSLSEWSSYAYTYDDNDKLKSYIYNAGEHEYTWSDENLTKLYFYTDEGDVNNEGLIDDKDTYEVTTVYKYTSYLNNANIDLAMLAMRGDYDEFEYAFTSDFFGTRSANLISERIYESLHGLSTETMNFDNYTVDTFEYTFTDELLTSIIVTSADASSADEIDSVSKGVTTITLEYCK